MCSLKYQLIRFGSTSLLFPFARSIDYAFLSRSLFNRPSSSSLRSFNRLIFIAVIRFIAWLSVLLFMLFRLPFRIFFFFVFISSLCSALVFLFCVFRVNKKKNDPEHCDPFCRWIAVQWINWMEIFDWKKNWFFRLFLLLLFPKQINAECIRTADALLCNIDVITVSNRDGDRVK